MAAQRKYERSADRIGKRYGKLVLKRLLDRKNCNYRYEFECDCGTVLPLWWNAIKRGRRDCGCRVPRNDGRSGGREYYVWKQILTRCHERTSAAYPRYGGRGIRVCKRWQSYRRFLEDVGRSPGPRYSLVLNDGAKLYEPGSCRWLSPWDARMALRSTEAKNRRWQTVLGIRMISVQWAEVCGITRERMRQRFRDYSPHEAVLIYPAARKWLAAAHGIEVPAMKMRKRCQDRPQITARPERAAEFQRDGRLSQQDRAERRRVMASAVDGGDSLAQVAADFGVTKETVRKAVLESGQVPA
jgi:hypothetical protein